MSKYTPHTEQDIKEMLETVGVNSLDDLYVDVPKQIKIDGLPIQDGKTQYAVEQEFRSLAKENFVYDTILCGGGIYDHIIPSVVNSLSSREEFVTAYTPYQAEMSQGVLQSIFEYQTQMCQLTGLDVSNASVYDGATAVAESIVMCCDRKNKAIITGQINPQYLLVAKTYCFAHNIELVFVPSNNGLVDIERTTSEIDDNTACVIAQSPNYFGLIEDMASISQAVHQKNVKFVYVFNPIAISILPSAGEVNADIAVGEGQPLGLPLAYGGATLGIMTCTTQMCRRLPGRIVGQTVDVHNNRCFVLTMQAREQHIRREKATSSICSNQSLNALIANIYLSTVGKNGIVDIAHQCVDKAHYLADKFVENGGKLKYDGEFFNEFVLLGDNTLLNKVLKLEGILGGMPAPDGSLWCVTEKVSKEKLDLVAKVFNEVQK